MRKNVLLLQICILTFRFFFINITVNGTIKFSQLYHNSHHQIPVAGNSGGFMF